jgi:tetratricopeptide (TPR) repeat protein
MAGNRDVYARAMQMALDYSRDHNWKAAVEAYKQALIEFPQDVPATLGIGNVLLEAGQLPAALKAFERAVQLSPHEAQALNRLADTRERLGLLDQAVASRGRVAGSVPETTAASPPDSSDQVWGQLEAQAVGLPPRDEDGLFGCENLASEEDAGGHGPFDQARRRALQELAGMLFDAEAEGGLKPAVVTGIARALDQQTRGLLSEAIKSLRKAQDNGLARTALHYILGVMCYECRQYDEAVEAFCRCLPDKEYALASHYALGLTYQAAGTLDQALEHFVEVVQAVDLQAAHPEQIGQLSLAYQRLAERRAARSDAGAARSFIQTLIQFFSRRNWQRELGRARQDMDSLSENGEAMTLAEYLETPATEIVVTTLGLTAEYMRRKMLMTALEECYYAIEQAPSQLALHTRLADILLLQEHTETAISKYSTIAEVCRMRGELQQAKGIYQKILGLTPMDVQARHKLIDLLLEREEIDQALEHYLVLADSHYQLAQLTQALEEYGEALTQVARSTDRKKWEVQILYRMGDIFNQRVDWARATAAFESIVAIAPDDERALMALIELGYRQTQADRAVQWLDRLLALFQAKGEEQKVLVVLQEAVQSHPRDVRVRARLAAAYVHCGLTPQAIAEYDRLGKVQLAAGLRGEAARTLQTIINLDPPNVDEYQRILVELQGSG